MGSNYAKLRGKIREVCGTEQDFSTKVGLTKNSVSRMLNGKTDWSQKHIIKACEVLGINQVDIGIFFFNE